MFRADPAPRVLLAHSPDGQPCFRAVYMRCDWPTIPGTRGLDDAVETVLTVLEDAHGFTFQDRVLVGQMASRDILGHAGYPDVECGPVTGLRGRLIDETLSQLTCRDLVHISWKVAGWLQLCAKNAAYAA